MPTGTLGRKQGLAAQDPWLRTIEICRRTWTDEKLDALVASTVAEIKETIRGKRVAFGWSGGKDSLALEIVCREAGIEDCVLAISELEYPEMLRWITTNMPPGLTVINTGQDLVWLAKHPHMLFPQGHYGPQWFSIINHRGQDTYYKQQKLDVLLLGRRRVDGNQIPKDKIATRLDGAVRYSPLADWSHEAVFALLQQRSVGLAPCYRWPRGYQVGTGSWPARQWTRDHEHGWREVYAIDPAVVADAALVLPEAASWLARNT